MKPIFYKQEMAERERICTQEGSRGSCSISRDQELLDKISTGHKIQFLKFHGIKLPLGFSKLFNSLITILIETFTVIAPMFFLYPQASIPFLSLCIVIG